MTVPRPISAENWNSLVRFISTNHIVGFLNQSRVVFRHPWQCRCRYDGAAKNWQVQVNPGLVAAEFPEIRDSSAPKEDWEDKTTPPLRPISDDPWLALPGNLHISPILIPEYFAKKGVVSAIKQVVNFDAEEVQISGREVAKIPPNAEQRWLKKVDLVLKIPRVAGKVSLEVDGFGISGINLGFEQPSGPPLIYATQEYRPPDPIQTDDIFIAQAQDLPFDLIHLSRIWFLSPLGAGADAKVDATWTPYPEHRVFWNLNHGVKVPEPGLIDISTGFEGLISIGSILGGGAGANALRLIGLELRKNAVLSALMLARVKVTSRVWSV